MPPVRDAKRRFTMAEFARSPAWSRVEKNGLAFDYIDINAVEAVVLDNESLNIEMIDAHIDKLIVQSLKDSRWASKNPTSPQTDTLITIEAKTNTAQASPITHET